MGMKWKNGIKKILTQALVASLLLAPAVLPPTGTGEGGLPGEVLTGSEQPGTDDGGENGISPCGDLEDESELQYIAS
ncbi:MAG: hypothetical protein HFH94_17835 [Lachnospiraceae bacterium]|jgi:hypothetical protein|nr:hypothetical protein [uncultured Acetatifactor sp.]MCI9221536.1 hypothetical protein [Lachnospiraceae bacterium]